MQTQLTRGLRNFKYNDPRAGNNLKHILNKKGTILLSILRFNFYYRAMENLNNLIPI